MTAYLDGQVDWSCERDKDGHRDYDVSWLVETTDYADGPGTVMFTPGLPVIGATWALGNDIDLWAFCWPQMKITAVPGQDREGPQFWIVTQRFSTRPLTRCQDTPIENPLNEPIKVRGSFSKFTKEIWQDRYGNVLQTSSFEPLKGKIVEFDDNRPTISIGMNVLALPLSSYAPMIDNVNDSPLWGLPSRCVKLSNVSFDRVLYGTCFYYYAMNYEFEINQNGFDRVAPDIGTKMLKKGVNPTAIDPTTGLQNYLLLGNYEVAKDDNGENTVVPLNGAGQLATIVNGIYQPAQIPVAYYNQSNFYLLNVPLSF